MQKFSYVNNGNPTNNESDFFVDSRAFEDVTLFHFSGNYFGMLLVILPDPLAEFRGSRKMTSYCSWLTGKIMVRFACFMKSN